MMMRRQTTKKKKLSNEEQQALKFAAYLNKEILPNRKKETFNEHLAYDEFEFLSRNKNLLFHHIDIDPDKVKFFRESDEFTPINLRLRTVVGNPTIQFSRF